MLALSLHNIDVGKVENLSMNEVNDPGTPLRGRQDQVIDATFYSNINS
jgi:hypothetical protein